MRSLGEQGPGSGRESLGRPVFHRSFLTTAFSLQEQEGESLVAENSWGRRPSWSASPRPCGPWGVGRALRRNSPSGPRAVPDVAGRFLSPLCPLLQPLSSGHSGFLTDRHTPLAFSPPRSSGRKGGCRPPVADPRAAEEVSDTARAEALGTGPGRRPHRRGWSCAGHKSAPQKPTSSRQGHG